MHDWFKGKERIPDFSQCPYCKNGMLRLKTGEIVLYNYKFYEDYKCKDCGRLFYIELNGPAKGYYRYLKDQLMDNHGLPHST